MGYISTSPVRITRKPQVRWRHYWRRRPCRAAAAPYPFAFARTALRVGLDALGLRAGDAVLCPDYICHSVTEVMARAGLRVDDYPVTDALAPDWAALEARVTATTRALLLVHYFGIPQDPAPFRACADRHGLLLIEDNAHGHGGQWQGRDLGTFGDMAISSPYKQLPIPNGGLLHLPPARACAVPDLPLEPIAVPWRLLRDTLRRCVALAPGLRTLWRASPPYASQQAFRHERTGDWAMDAAAWAHLQAVDTANLRRARQRLYSVWRNWAVKRGLAPVFSALPDGAVPLVFPARAPSSGEATAWFRWGYRNNVDVHSWPTLPEHIVRQNGRAMRLWERTLCFPLHQELDADALAAWLRR